MRILNALLLVLIVYATYESHYSVDLGLKGLNVVNLMFVAAVAMLVAKGIHAETPAPAKGYFIFLFVMLGLAFVVGEMRDTTTLVDDLTGLKNSIFYMLFYFVFYHAARDLKTMRLLFAGILLVVFLVALQGMRQALDYGIAFYSESHRVSGPFGVDYRSANQVAAYYVMFIPVLASVALFCKSRPVVRLFALGCTVLAVMSLFFTYSRQAYFIIALLMIYLALRRNLVLATIVIFAVVKYDAWVPQGVVDRIVMTEQTDEVGNTRLDESTESRFEIWSGAAQLITHNPWGIGLNHFKREIGEFAPTYSNMDAHNIFVLTMTEAGLGGIVALALLMFALFRLGRSVQLLDDREETKILGHGYTAAVAAVVLSNLYGSRFFDGNVMANFWMLSGIVARYYTMTLETRSTEKAASSAKAGEPLTAIAPVGVPR
ncbi:MAG TPA: O-antigen ligase family protein [Burkholderiaceae bacterium]|nr:O-antigen ligase family protein [Burkholderiaceae bacterium]